MSAHHILHYLIDMDQFHGHLALILYHSVMASHSGLQYESLDYLLGLIADVCFHLGKASSLPFEVLSKINNDNQEISNYLQEIGRMPLSKDRVRLTKQFLKNILGQPTSKLFAQDPNFLTHVNLMQKAVFLSKRKQKDGLENIDNLNMLFQ